MPKGISVVALLVISIGVLTSVSVAQMNAGPANPTTTRIATYQEVTLKWIAKGTMYGFVTCDRLRKRSSNGKLVYRVVSLDDITKCVAGGGRYAFGGGNLIINDAAEQAKLAPLAGKFVAVDVTMTSKLYGTGPNSDTAEDQRYSGARPVERYQVVSVAVDPTPDPREQEAEFSAALPEQRTPEE